jgi:hypothetical protein
VVDVVDVAWRMAGLEPPASLSLAPRTLTQSILPGWIVASNVQVTEANSTAPDTEQAIVATHSYGRQLGRMMDALAVLIDERPADLPPEPALEQFKKLRGEVEAIKLAQAAKRIDHVIADLKLLEKEHAEEYRQRVVALRAALDE